MSSPRSPAASRSPAGPSGDAAPEQPVTPDAAALARDWATLWQSELAAMAMDREAQETWQTMVALAAKFWTAMAEAAAVRPAGAAVAGVGGDRVRPSGAAGTAAAAGPASIAAALDPGDAAELRRRVSALEQRLAGYERDGRVRSG